MPNLQFIPTSEFDRIRAQVTDRFQRLHLVAEMARLNTLVEIKKAGSGHLGSSLSAMDLVTYLYLEGMNTLEVGWDSPQRDIFFSSKGHDVPGLYALLFGLGAVSEEKFLKLRRLNGLDGHPDVHVPGMEANTGSLGMGISKARGMSWAKAHRGDGGRVYVMTGDGELQEGQIWESMQTAAHHRSDVTVIVDHNKLQTDLPVEEIISLGQIEAKMRAFGWEVARCDGHDLMAIDAVLTRFASLSGPKVLIADTIKGRGISFMEKISECATLQGKYLWHSGAPADEPFTLGFDEILARINRLLAGHGLAAVTLKAVPTENLPKLGVSKQYIAAAYGEELVALAAEVPQLVVLDGDLSADCKVRGFHLKYPERFIENGIAEQDMVSVAGGMARQGYLPVCNSFATFLTARANEQIYNNACEGTKIIYATHFAGFIPAGPGKSHQSVRDISLMASVPGMTVFQPCSADEARLATRHAVLEATGNFALRLNIGPSPREIALPADYKLKPGCGTILREGKTAALIAYGPVMLHEALNCAEMASSSGLELAVINQPWLNVFDLDWVMSVLEQYHTLYLIDDHLLTGGMGERFLAFAAENDLLQGSRLRRIGLDRLPACGTPYEVLREHRMDGASLLQRIKEDLGMDSTAAATSGDQAVFNTLEAAQ